MLIHIKRLAACRMNLNLYGPKNASVQRWVDGRFLSRDATQRARYCYGNLSVRPSVCDIAVSWSHIGWNTSKIMSWLIGLGFLLSADHNITDLMKWKHPSPNIGWNMGGVYSESKKSPMQFSDIFPKRLGIFNQYFTHLLYVHIYARLQIFIQLSPTLTK